MKAKFSMIFVVMMIFSFSRIFGSDEIERCEHSRHKTDNNLGPNLLVSLTPCPLTDCFAVSGYAEGGNKNYRLSGTAGYFLSEDHRLKITGEYLAQRLRYNFSSGTQKKWMDQWAVGGVYQYCISNCWIDSAELYGSYSYASGKSLHTVRCLDSDSEATSRIHRHIAGGQDGHAAIGVTTSPWECASLALTGDYDYVVYHRKFHSDRKLSGIGGTIKLKQILPCNFAIDVKGEFRRPFTLYGGAVTWSNTCRYGVFTLGLYATQTNGRSKLPDSTTSGLYVNFAFGAPSSYTCCDSTMCSSGPCNEGPNRALLTWVSMPAVRMPTVLAIAEERRIVPCVAPTSSPIPEQFALPFDVSPFFNGNGSILTYSATGLPAGFSIDPSTGVITGDILSIISATINVTGTTVCGNTSQLVTITRPE